LIDDPIQQLIAQRDFAKAELTKRITEIRDLAANEFIKLPDGFEEKVAVLFQQIDVEFGRAIEKIERDGFKTFEPLEGVFDPITSQSAEERLEQAGREGLEAYKDGIEASLQDNRSAFEKTQDFFTDLFNIDEDELRQVADSVATIGDSLFNTLANFNEIQAAEQEKIISALDRQIANTERALQDEFAKREAGFANDVDLLEEKLAKEQQARQDAEQKRLELEKKAANQRLVINAALQASEYVLATIKLARSEAGFGIAGIFTALAGLAVLAKLISQAKAQSSQFDEVPQFREGTPYLEGPGTETSDSIVARLSKGERVVDAANNKKIGGAAVSNDQLVKDLEFADQVRALMKRTGEAGNSIRDQLGKYGSLSPMSKLTKEIIKKEKQIQQVQTEGQYRVMKEAYENAAERSANKMIAYWKSRPVEKLGAGGERLIEWYEGGKKRKQTVK
jgi:hypothetical protein